MKSAAGQVKGCGEASLSCADDDDVGLADRAAA
jgi:hypothetical protein